MLNSNTVTRARQRLHRATITLATVAAACLTASCPGASAAPAAPQFVLVGGTVSGNIAVLRVGSDGSLSKVSGSPFASGTGVLSLAMAPDGRTVYATQALGSAADGYKIDDNGLLHEIPGAKASLDGPPITGALSPDGTQYYVAVGGFPGHISSFAVSATGTLSPEGQTQVPGMSALTMVTVDPSNHFVRVTDYLDGNLQSFAVGTGGKLTPIGSVPTGGGPNNPGYTPDGKFVYVSHELASEIRGYAIGPDGKLTPTPGSPYPAGQMTHGAQITSDGHRLYVPEAASGDVRGYSIATDGSLTPLAGSPYHVPGALAMPGQVLLSSDERHLYVADVLTTHITTIVHTFDVSADGSLRPSALPDIDAGVVMSDGPVLVKTH
ncbi:lactonase family protein [Nocardia stercoris]|uniref:Lactonase family protein n=1 Tax=Nocardia stercoris TaxID=2483361 RepID=A0A3M2KWE8_9NOCA|nr:beta-propeller fold lactonase family protein [Nocardia stercoris]RMI28780.1 hypothetical protein EBN03_28270 [Nocardia stercoris]